MIGLIIPVAFQLQFMVLAIDIMHGLTLVMKCVRSYRLKDQGMTVKPKKRKKQQMASYALYITNKKRYGHCHRYNIWAWPE